MEYVKIIDMTIRKKTQWWLKNYEKHRIEAGPFKSEQEAKDYVIAHKDEIKLI